jgi:hypothetical protein
MWRAGPGKHNRMIAVILVLLVVAFCALFHTTTGTGGLCEADGQERTVTLEKQSELTAYNSIPTMMEKENLSVCRHCEHNNRLRIGRSGFFYACMVVCFRILEGCLLTFFLANLFFSNDITPRYSMISYIHRSHGKKADCITE